MAQKCDLCEKGYGLERIAQHTETLKYHRLDEEGNPTNPCLYPEVVNDDVTVAKFVRAG